MKPNLRPANPSFSSGPCAKRPGWTWKRSKARCSAVRIAPSPASAKLDEVVDRSRAILGIPND